MFGLAPSERFDTWHFIRRRAAGILRRIVLAFMDRILKFRGWMRPSLGVQLSLPWLPRGHTRACMRSMLSSIGELHNQGVAILVPKLKRLKVSVTRVHMVTLSKMAHNAPHTIAGWAAGKNGSAAVHGSLTFPDMPLLMVCCISARHRTAGTCRPIWSHLGNPITYSCDAFHGHPQAACKDAVVKVVTRLGIKIDAALLDLIVADAALALYASSLLHGGELAA